MADELTIKVVNGSSENLHVRVDLASASVLQLKQLIEQQDARRFPVAAQRLIFQGQILQDAKLLSECHVAAGCALHLTLTPGAVAAANAQADREAAAAPSSGPAPPAQLRAFLQQMREYETSEQFGTAVTTLQKICANIVGHPTEDKYRKLRVDNAALKSRLFDRTRGQDSVKLLGFQDGVQPGHLVLVPTPEKWENLVACKAVVDAVAATVGSAAPAATVSPFGTAPMGGFGGMGGDFASQAQALLQNPAMLQSMANNPMVQQMAQQNPMLAQALQNPALLSQSIQAMQQNPAMMQQVNQMMSDPNALARMQQMMAGGGMGGFGGLGGLGGAPFGAAAPSSAAAANPFAGNSTSSNPFASVSSSAAPAAPASAPAPAVAATPTAAVPSSSTASSSAAATSTDNTDDDAYEEDEIAQAIARSLQDQ